MENELSPAETVRAVRELRRILERVADEMEQVFGAVVAVRHRPLLDEIRTILDDVETANTPADLHA